MIPTWIYITAGYILLGVVIYLVQDRFIFKPEKLSADFKYKMMHPSKSFSLISKKE